MTDLKCRISTPLEAGTSILDAHRLPSHLTPALEYTSKRLASKGLHITLVVVRKDYQLPQNANADAAANASEYRHPVSSLPTPPRSPEFPDSTACAVPRTNSFKSTLSRSGSARDTKPSQWRKVVSLPRKASIASILDGAIGRRWPLTLSTAPTNVPKTPATPTTPATPASFASSTTTTTTTSCTTMSSTMGEAHESQGPCLRMLHTTALAPKAQSLVTTTLARATHRFGLTNALTAVEPSAYSIPSIVLHGSILQNEVLFSSEGLTLLSMDHLYTFKTALAHYTTGRTEPGSDFRLEDAVDDLRRYVLSSAGGRRRLLKSVLVQAYDWLGPINDFALSDVMEMYCRAYGGATGDCGVEDDLMPRKSPVLASVESIAEEEPATQPAGPSPTPLSSWLDIASAVEDKPQEAFFKGLPSTADASVPSAGTSAAALSQDAGKAGAAAAADHLQVVRERTNNTPPTDQTEEQDSNTPTQQPPQLSLQTTPYATTTTPPFLKTSSPRTSPNKASLPALRVQTSFTTQQPPIKPKPRRKETPIPGPSSLIHHQQQPRKKKQSSQPVLMNVDADTVPLSALPRPVDNHILKAKNNLFGDHRNTNMEEGEGDISIQIHADDDDDDDDEDEANLTEFEDADLTARPPPSATCGRTPVEPMWSGIDAILGNNDNNNNNNNSDGGSGNGSRPGSKRGGIMLPSSHQHRRRSSSLVLQRDNAGPATPNGYDDISPITRGEWGFLMVSDPFRTKTAAVSCV